jgi:hypothetical protein
MSQIKDKNINCSQARETFPDYLTGDIETGAVERVRSHVASCTDCRRELEELTSTWTQLGVLPEEQPGPNLRKNFYTMLESYKEGLERENIWQRIANRIFGTPGQPRRPAFQLAFSLIFLIISFGAGYYISSPSPSKAPGSEQVKEVNRLHAQVQQMRQQLVLAMLDQSSPSQRLKAISWSSTVENPGEETLTALLDTLNNDPNVNVRVSAAEALYLFADHPLVKQGIVESLPKQTSPLVQMALIDLMVQLREKKAAEALKLLIRNNKLNPLVKQRAKLAMDQII